MLYIDIDIDPRDDMYSHSPTVDYMCTVVKCLIITAGTTVRKDELDLRSEIYGLVWKDNCIVRL